ncbi:YdcF family protein [Mongoliitalea daihaiensis]|uniref:YdcF family protein n=1 Tax=Mongoliitalea daihaiensis TaxID=2782006 RepID=UPI001F3541AE|nr:YdcF family protein [Mongoliitalea daihaiensis]UJP63337.1 YdcF family protein [Mongoliitalea daihaiensis]
MFFILSQFLSFLVMPLTLIFLGLITGFYWPDRKKGKKIILLSIISLCFFSNQFLANWAMQRWEPNFIPLSEVPKHDIGIVLTGVTNLSKTTYDRTFFNKGADRITHALQLYKEGNINRILITGGQGLNPTNPNTEAKLLKDFLLVAGVPETDIIIEDQAKNTYQNAIFTKETLQELDIPADQSFILITSAFHMKRAKGCFEKAGFITYPFPTDYYASDTKWDIPHLFYPDPYAIFMWHKLVKEWMGIAMYKVAGYM